MDPAMIEETNRLRVSLGMKPLPVPGAQPSAASATVDPDAPSTLETREALAYDNYNKIQEAEQAKKRREQKAAAVKKAREAAQRFAVLDGKGLGDASDEEEMDAKAWLLGQKKRQKKIAKVRQAEEQEEASQAAAKAALQYTSKDLAGVKIGHDMSAFLDGDEQVLTLKDTTIDENEAEGDELENLTAREQERLKDTLDLKKRRPGYNPLDDNEDGESHGVLAQYDDEIYGKKRKRFVLDADGAIAEPGDGGDGPGATKKLQNISLDFLDGAPQSSDYLDISEIKVKKPKKKSKSTRKKTATDDDDDVLFSAPLETDTAADTVMDDADTLKKKRKINSDSFADEDLHDSLKKKPLDLKKRKKTTAEELARQLLENGADHGQDEANEEGGLVIGEITGFVSALQKSDLEPPKPRKPTAPTEISITAMEEDNDEDQPMVESGDYERETAGDEHQPELTSTGVDVEETFDEGIGSTLKFLRERKLVADSNAGELNDQFRSKQEFLQKKRRMEEDMEELARHQRDRDRNNGRLDRMSIREREDYARQQNTNRDHQQSRKMVELFNANYKPSIALTYTDDHGRSLNQKEAFKHLSHQFHGRGSGKGKTDKLLKKIEDEKRRESQSMLDASQNVGMSSAAAQQTKKRREAGVRLA